METMQKYTKQDIINMVEDEDVEFIRMQFTDIEGNFKNVAITASRWNKSEIPPKLVQKFALRQTAKSLNILSMTTKCC